MKRRRALSTIGSVSAIALTGCTSGRNSSTPDEQSLRIEAASIPDDSEIDLQVRVTNDRGTSTPPALRVEMETTVDQELQFGPYRPLSSPTAVQEDGETELLLIPENLSHDGTQYYVPATAGANFVPDEPQDGCWTATTDVDLIRQLAVQVDLAAGDTEANSYHVLNSPHNSGCFSPGRFRVRDSVGAGGTDYDWRFDLVVE